MADTGSQIHTKWLGKLLTLNPATGRGICHGKAPHKPLLLISLLDLVEDGELMDRTFTRCPGLVLRFRTYGGLVGDRCLARLDLSMPFYHLRSQGFWTVQGADGSPGKWSSIANCECPTPRPPVSVLAR